MKKTLSLILALVLVLSCTAAFAQYGEVVNPAPYAPYAVVAGNGGGETATTYDVYVFPVSLTTGEPDAMPAQVYAGNTVGTPTNLIVTPSVKDAAQDDAEQKYLVVVLYNDGTVESYNFHVNNQTDGNVVFAEDAWYPDNTACVFGPQMDGSWKTYAVVDLSVEGTQNLKLVGAGAWLLGNVSVTVTGDEVVVNYLMTEDIITKDVHDDITVDSEYVNIYADVESMDIAAESAYAFGQPISIANDLGGDTTVVLYVQLQVDYPAHCPYVYRFWPNLWQNKSIVSAMNDLLAAEAEVAEEVAE